MILGAGKRAATLTYSLEAQSSALLGRFLIEEFDRPLAIERQSAILDQRQGVSPIPLARQRKKNALDCSIGYSMRLLGAKARIPADSFSSFF